MCGSVRTSLATYALSVGCMAVVWQQTAASGGQPPPPHVRYLVAFVLAFATMQLVDAGLWLSIQRSDATANRILGRYVLPVVLALELLVAYYGAVWWLNAPRTLAYEALLWIVVACLVLFMCADGALTVPGPDGYLRWCGGSRARHAMSVLFLVLLVGPLFVYYPHRPVAYMCVALAVGLWIVSAALGDGSGTFGTRWCWTANVAAPILALLAVTGAL